MKKIILMVGVPGSGKSTWIQNHLDEGDTWVSRDKIRFEMIKENEPYFSREKDVFDEFVKQINEAVAATENGYVFADATHLNYSSRMRVLSRIEDRNILVDAIVFNVPLEVALERNAQRVGRAYVPEESICDMFKSMSFPEKGEAIDHVFYIDEEGFIYKVETLGGRLK